MDKALEIILALVVIGATLAFGGVQPIAYSAMEVVLFLALFLRVARQTYRGDIKIPMPTWFLVFILWGFLQILPLPIGLISSISPNRVLAGQIAGLLPGHAGWMTFSIYPHSTLVYLFKLLAYLSAFILAASLFDSTKRKSILIRILVYLGGFEAAYGIFQYLTGWQKIFFYTKEYDLIEATGTYINRNHFAGFLELVLPFVVATVFYSFQRWTGERSEPRGRHANSERTSAGFQIVFYLFLAVLIGVGVVFSASRMGILASLSSVVLMSLLIQLKVRRKVWMLGIVFLLVSVLGYGIWIGLDPVMVRFVQLKEPGFVEISNRFVIWKDTLHLIRDYPLSGTGLGTYELAYRRYQSNFPDKLVDHAHGDYLEFLAESGPLGVLLLFLPIFYLFVRMMLSFLDDPRRYRRAVMLGCIGSTFALLVHSLADFNLQIPANALIFSVVLGVAYKIAFIERARDEQAGIPLRRFEEKSIPTGMVH